MAPSDTNCNRCGREIPALSDCGGFYDLVPQAKKSEEVPSIMASEPSVQASGSESRSLNLMSETPEASARMEASPKKSAQESKVPARKQRNMLLIATAATGAAAVLFLLLLVVSLIKVNHNSNQLQKLQHDLRVADEKVVEMQAAAEQETTVPTVTPDPVLAEQDVVFSVAIPEEDSDEEMKAELDLGDYEDTAVITYGLDASTGTINSISYSLKEADTAVKLTIDHKNESRNRNVTLSYEIDEDIYGASEASDAIKWKYRFDAESEWEDLPEDVFERNDDAGETGLTIQNSALQKLTKEHKGQMELRCEIARTNLSAGSQTIVLEGIRFRNK